MGSEMSAKEGSDYQNGNVKKDDDLYENGADENDRDREGKAAQDMGSKYKNDGADENDRDREGKAAQDMGSKYKNDGDIRSRKPVKAGSRTKAELRKAILKTKQPSMNEQHKPIAIPKWLSPIYSVVMFVENTLPSRFRRLLVFLTIVGLAFGTRLFSVTLPPHIWLVKVFVFIKSESIAKIDDVTFAVYVLSVDGLTLWRFHWIPFLL